MYLKDNLYLKYLCMYISSLLSSFSLIRRFFLDMVAEINDDRVLKFLHKRFISKDVSANEAVQTLLIAMNHLQPRAELVEKAKVS